jgi:hypothetical protein
VHFRIAPAILVFRRGRCCNQGGVDDRSLAQQQAFLGQVTIDGVEDRFSQLMAFEQVTEVQQRRGVGG